MHAYAEPRAVDTGAELDARAMPLGDALDDRQSQTAAAHARCRIAARLPTVEPVEHPLALGGRDSRAVVANPERAPLPVLSGGDVDATAARGVAQGVVDQIGEERP